MENRPKGVEVPIPTLPNLVFAAVDRVRSDVLVVDVAKLNALVKLFAIILVVVVPWVNIPLLEIENSVVVAPWVEDPMANSKLLGGTKPLLAWIESIAEGVVVPCPTLPALVIVSAATDEVPKESVEVPM
jgi:hypothetical protein